MDIREYISSGILELYACNALSADERKGVEDVVMQYHEVAAELRLIEQSLDGLADKMAASPSAEVRSAILDDISEDGNGGGEGTGEPSVPAGPAVQHAVGRESNVRGINVKIYKWMLAASVALLLVSSYLAASFYTKWKSSSDRVLALQQQQTLLAGKNKVLTNNYQSTLAMLRTPATRIVTLAVPAQQPASKAMLY